MVAEKTKKTYYVSAKSKWLALLLSTLGLIGFAGIHRFYVGKILSGCLYFCTLGIFGIGTIYDIIKICVDDFEDADGFPLYSDSSMKSNYKRRNLQSPPGIIKILVSLFASLVLFSMIVSFTLVKIINPNKTAHESAENSPSSESSRSFSDQIRACESQVTKEEMDLFLDDAKRAHLSEQNVKNLCATLKSLKIDFLKMDKLNLDVMKRKKWTKLPGKPSIEAQIGIHGVHEIAFQIPNIENLNSTEDRYLIIHVDTETKQVKSISVRETFDPIDGRLYDKFAYYLCYREKKGENKGILKKVGDYSKTFVSKEAIANMTDIIKTDVNNNRGKNILIGEFVYNVAFADDYNEKYDEPFIEVDVECIIPSQTYGVNEEKVYKTFKFFTDGQIKDNPSWSRNKKQK